jgi:hypothetical protein
MFTPGNNVIKLDNAKAEDYKFTNLTATGTGIGNHLDVINKGQYKEFVTGLAPVVLSLYDLDRNFTVYLKPAQTTLEAGDTLLLDVMLTGDKYYSQAAAEISYDSALLEFDGYGDLAGWAASVTQPASGKIAVRSVPGMNMVVGAPCGPEVKLVTLKFKLTGAITGGNLDTTFNFASAAVSPAGGVTGAIAIPGRPVTVSWLNEIY